MILHLLRAAFPDVYVCTLIPEDPPYPFILVRGSRGLGLWDGDPRGLIDAYDVEIQVFTMDPDGDEAGALISEAVRVALRDAWLSHTHVPGIGSVIQITMQSKPRRVTDWATSAGPVQYADLPTGGWRYETQYAVSIRKELR